MQETILQATRKVEKWLKTKPPSPDGATKWRDSREFFTTGKEWTSGAWLVSPAQYQVGMKVWPLTIRLSPSFTNSPLPEPEVRPGSKRNVVPSWGHRMGEQHV